MKLDKRLDIPDEIFLKILSCLETQDLAKLMQVNKYWYQFVGQDAVWRQAAAAAFQKILPENQLAELKFLNSVRVLVRNSFIKGELGENRITKTIKKLNDKQAKLEELRKGPEREESNAVMAPPIYYMVTPVGTIAQIGYSNTGSNGDSMASKAGRWISTKFTERKINQYKKQLGALSDETKPEETLTTELKKLTR